MCVGCLLAAAIAPATSAAADPVAAKRANIEEQLDFASPESAAEALLVAFKSNDNKALLDIFGHDHEKLVVVTDKVARADALAELHEAAMERWAVEKEGESRCTLVFGRQNWPFPIPLVLTETVGGAAGRWLFDTDSGEEEIINRRIGKNELGAIEVCNAYVDAQNDYAEVDRDGDDVLEYAQRLGSTKGKRDGLYWFVDDDEDDAELSPFGPLLADADSYLEAAKNSDNQVIPFNGYYYKILSGQGADAPGGEHSFIINGNMIAGFGLVACPADYDSSGIMTLLISHQGKVYEKDLGAGTHETVKAMSKYNPDSTWRLAEED